ncbi:hypothetical protein ACVWYF_004023 [Hymenobacter sp. UYAg731]
MFLQGIPTDPLSISRDYSELFEAFRIFGSGDICLAVKDWQHRYMSTSWEHFGRHLERMRNYLADSKLEADKKHSISCVLELQQGTYLTGATYPEKRQYINEQDRLDLRSRRTQLVQGFPFEEEYPKSKHSEERFLEWEKQALKIIDQLDKRLKVLDVKRNEPAHVLNSTYKEGERRSASLELQLLQNNSASKKGRLGDKPNNGGESKARKSLADLCIPNAKETQKQIAEFTKTIWNSLPPRIKTSPSTRTEHKTSASAAAVFNLMQWIGKVEDTNIKEWKYALEEELDIVISEGISKYRICSDVDKQFMNKHFVKAVAAAWIIIKKDHPGWLKKAKALPNGYN